MLQTWATQEAYEAYLQDCRDRAMEQERDRRRVSQRCEHEVSLHRTCKACGIPEYWEDWLQRAWAAAPGPGKAELCSCGVTTHSDGEWDRHIERPPLVLLHTPRV